MILFRFICTAVMSFAWGYGLGHEMGLRRHFKRWHSAKEDV